MDAFSGHAASPAVHRPPRVPSANPPKASLSLSQHLPAAALAWATGSDPATSSAPIAPISPTGSTVLAAAAAPGGNNNSDVLGHSSSTRRTRVESELSKRRREYTETSMFKLFGTTWNVNGHRPVDHSVYEWLAISHYDIDIYMIAIQEVQNLSGMNAVTTDPDKGRQWKQSIEKSLTSAGRYVCISARQMVGISLFLYVREELENDVRDVMVIDVGTGFLNYTGNKGGVAARFSLRGVQISCVSSHLAAHEKNVDRRNQDFHEVIRRATFSLPTATNPATSDPSSIPDEPELGPVLGGGGRIMSIMDHDVIFFMGDLNYRISIPVEEVLNMIKNKEFEALNEYDQLNIARRSGRVLKGFKEGPLSFAPTYKYDLNGVDYSMDDEGGIKRTPSWCDRILWLVRKHNPQEVLAITQGNYSRAEVLGSDHRPVWATFELVYGTENESRKAEVANEAHRMLDIEEENKRPQLKLSTNEVQFPDVEFNEEVSKVVSLSNNGQVPCKVKVLWEDFPDWLKVDFLGRHMDQEIAPGERIEAVLKVLVNTASESSLISFGDEELVATVRLHLVGGSDHFIFVQGNYVKSCFGLSLDQMVRATRPMRTREAVSLCPPEEVTAGIPAELWLLGEAMMTQPERGTRGVEQKDLFTGTARKEDVGYVRDCIDSRVRIPTKVDPTAVATCLVQMLAHLEDPVVSRDFLFNVKVPSGGGGCSDAGNRVEEIIRPLPALKYNAFVYVAGLAREHCRCANLDSAARQAVAGIIGNALIGGRLAADLGADGPISNLKQMLDVGRLVLPFLERDLKLTSFFV